MSALSVGSVAFSDEVARQRVEAVAEAADVADDAVKKRKIETAVAPTREDALSAIVKWVPGEVIGTYSAVVAALIAASSGKPERATGAEGWLLGVFMLAAAAMTILGGNVAFRKVSSSGRMPKTKRAELFVRGGLSAIGLLIWSCVIPGTVTNRSDLLIEYEGAASAMVFFIAIVFGLFAEFMVLPATLRGIVRRFS